MGRVSKVGAALMGSIDMDKVFMVVGSRHGLSGSEVEELYEELLVLIEAGLARGDVEAIKIPKVGVFYRDGDIAKSSIKEKRDRLSAMNNRSNKDE